MKYTSENIDQLCRYCARQLQPNYGKFSSCVELQQPLIKDISTTPDQIISIFAGLDVTLIIAMKQLLPYIKFVFYQFSASSTIMKFPKFVCHECIIKISDIYMFHQKCLLPANRKLNDLVRLQQYQNVIPATSSSANTSKFPCKICSTLFQTSKSLKNHELQHHQADKMFCEICCQYYCNSVKSQNVHVLMHANNICYFCSRGFNNEQLLNKHMLAIHLSTAKKKFCCVFCSIKVTTKVALEMHLKKRHNVTVPQVYCGHCSNVTQSESMVAYESCEKLAHHITIEHNISESAETMLEQCCNNKLDKVVDDVTMFEEFLDEKFANTCDELLFQQILDNDTAAHNSLANDCKHCSHTFQSEKDLIMHDITEHLPAAGYPTIESGCQTANTKLDTSPANTLRYKCPKCIGIGKVYAKQSQLIMHLAHDHNDSVLSCNECGMSFNRLNDLTNHRRDHQIDKHLIEVISMLDDPNFDNIEIVEDPKKQQQVIYRCRLCDKTFHRKTAMEQHACTASNTVASAPATEQLQVSVQCTECTVNFQTISMMEKHRRNMHNVCSLCDKKFQTIGGLKYHLKTHTGSKPFTCPYECSLKFTAKVNLNAHIRNVHASVKLYKCTVCARKFTSSDHLRKHNDSQHRMLRRYECDDCDKKFFQRTHLVQHRWIHTGVKPFACEFCPKMYTSRSSLRKHLASDHD